MMGGARKVAVACENVAISVGFSDWFLPDLLSYGSRTMDAETIRIISGILAVFFVVLYVLRRRKRL